MAVWPSPSSGASAPPMSWATAATRRTSASSSACPTGSSGASCCRGGCASLFSAWFCFFFMADDDLGQDPEEERPAAWLHWPTALGRRRRSRPRRTPWSPSAPTWRGVFLLGALAHQLLARLLPQGVLPRRPPAQRLGAGLTYVATSVSAGSFVGFPSLIYLNGWIMALWIAGYMVGGLVSKGVLAKRLNQVSRLSGAITVPDVLATASRARPWACWPACSCCCSWSSTSWASSRPAA